MRQDAVLTCAHAPPSRTSLQRPAFQRPELPIRDWASTEADPAVVLVRLLRANAQLVNDLNERFADAGLPSFDIARLLWLWSEHRVPLAITTVARGLSLSPSASSRLVARAEQLGLVERSGNDLDGRETSVRVTMRGRAAIHRFDAALRAAARNVTFDAAVAEWFADAGRVRSVEGRRQRTAP